MCKLFIALLVFTCVSCSSVSAVEFDNYAVYYSDKIPAKKFKNIDLLVLDSKYHPNLKKLKKQGSKLLGYISLGEVESHRKHFEAVKKQGILFHENKYWKGSYFVDVRSQKWVDRVVKELVPAILAKGFDGIFMDTLDNPGELEYIDPKKHAGMVDGGVHLVKTLRKYFPDMIIMMNRGYELLPELAPYIDIEMGESVYADYNFEDKNNRFVKTSVYKEQVKMLQDAKKINPNLKIVSLDYWDINDKKGVKHIFQEQRKNGFIPYVSTIKLDKLVPAP